jgi:hypothetical protein
MPVQPGPMADGLSPKAQISGGKAAVPFCQRVELRKVNVWFHWRAKGGSASPENASPARTDGRWTVVEGANYQAAGPSRSCGTNALSRLRITTACRGTTRSAFCAKRFRSAMPPRIAFNRSCISKKRREDALLTSAVGRTRPVASLSRKQSQFSVSPALFIFLRTSPRDFRRKKQEEEGCDIKQGCVDFGAGPRVRVHDRYPS